MMRALPRVIAVVGTMALAPLALAADTKADCNTVLGIDAQKSYTADPADVQACAQRGYDPPKTWRPGNGVSSGVRVGGSGGFSYGTVESPDNSPGAVNAKASTSFDLMKFACQMLSSFSSGSSCSNLASGALKDKNGVTATPGSVTPQGATMGSCPAETDTSGVFGAKQALPTTGAPAPLSLPCGGAVPLARYEIVLNPNAIGFAMTTGVPINGVYYIYFYQMSGNGYTISAGSPFPMPTYLSQYDGKHKLVAVPGGINPPMPQVITYNQQMGGILIHLVPKTTVSTASDKNTGNISVSVNAESEMYLLIGLNQGAVTMTRNTNLQSDYYKSAASLSADMIIRPTSAQNCGAPPAASSTVSAAQQAAATVASCSGMNALASSFDANCDTATLNLKGACTGQVQYAVLDHPNLVYGAGETPTLLPVQQAAFLMAPTTGTSQYFTQFQTIIDVWNTMPPITLTDGGRLGMSDGSQLVMNAGTVLNPAGPTVTLPNGGELVNSGGGLICDYPTNSSYPGSTCASPPTPTYPLKLQLGRGVTLPAGYQLLTVPDEWSTSDPSSAAAYVRLPAVPPK